MKPGDSVCHSQDVLWGAYCIHRTNKMKVVQCRFNTALHRLDSMLLKDQARGPRERANDLMNPVLTTTTRIMQHILEQINETR